MNRKVCNFDENSCFNKVVDERDLIEDFVKKIVDKMGPTLESSLGLEVGMTMGTTVVLAAGEMV